MLEMGTSIRCLMLIIDEKVKDYQIRQTKDEITPVISGILDRHEKSQCMLIIYFHHFLSTSPLLS